MKLTAFAPKYPKSVKEAGRTTPNVEGQLYLGVMEEKRGTGGGGGGALQKWIWGMETSSIGQTIWGGGSEGQLNIPFQCFFSLFLPALFCKQEKENKKNKQINKNMGGAV